MPAVLQLYDGFQDWRLLQLQLSNCWTAIPVCFIYVLSLLGNTTILHMVKSIPSLRTPMYLFLSMLSVADLGLTVSTLPSMAAVFLLGQRKVGAATCFVQLFVHPHMLSN